MKCSIKSAMEYKISFLVKSIFMFINNGFFLVFWLIVFSANNGNINGISMDTILYLWSIPVIAFGISYFFFGGVENINSYIITGQMDSYMLQPKHPLLNILTSKCNFSAFGDLMYGITIGVVASKGSITSFLLILVLGIFGSIFFVSTSVILRSLTVWISDTENIAYQYMGSLLVQFSIYPEELFNGILKVLLYTVVPVAYIAYIPMKIVQNFNMLDIIWLFLVGLLYTIVAIFVFNKAMKNYESGNTISMRN
jgi:ABC-2 type transport system permease protein